MSGRVLRTKLRRDVGRQPSMFAAIVVMITLGVALFAASYDAYRNLESSYAELHERLGSSDLWITGGDTEQIAQAAMATDGVAQVETRTQADVALRIGADEKLRGRIISVPGTQPPAMNRLLLRTGRFDLTGSQALVEQHLYEHFDLDVGDRVAALSADGRTWRPLQVAGEVASAEHIWPARSRQDVLTLPDNFGVLFVAQPTANELTGRGPNQVVLRLADGADPEVLDTVRRQAEALGATEVLTREEQPSDAVLREDIEGFSTMSVAFPLLFLTAAGMAVYVLITRRVQTERALIGMMLASGLQRRQILRHYLSYGLAAGVLGSVVGVAIGLAAARTMTQAYLAAIDLPEQVAVYDIRVGTVLGGLAFGTAVGALSAAAPALAASRITPAEAMRGVIPPIRGRFSLLERVVPPLRRLPTRWRLVLRGIGRNRRRTAATVVGVTLSLLLILTSWSMLDTMDELIDTQFGRVQVEDARVDFTGPQPGAALDRLRAVDGVAEVEPMTAAPLALRGPGGSYGSTLLALPRDTDLHGFVRPDGSETSLSGDGVLIGAGAKDLIDADVGETATVDVPRLGIHRELTIDGYLDEPLGTYVYLSRTELERLSGQPAPITSALLRLDDGADREAIRHAVEQQPDVASYEDTRALADLFDEYAALFYGFIGAMLILGALMAFAIMFTTMSVNITERSREVAMLRAGGVRIGQISRLISSENLLMTALGIVPGVICGVVGGRLLLESYSSDLFQLDLVVSPVTLLTAVGAILVVALLSQWPSLRAVRRFDIATVVRERDA